MADILLSDTHRSSSACCHVHYNPWTSPPAPAHRCTHLQFYCLVSDDISASLQQQKMFLCSIIPRSAGWEKIRNKRSEMVCSLRRVPRIYPDYSEPSLINVTQTKADYGRMIESVRHYAKGSDPSWSAYLPTIYRLKS